jgi:hypothetical protein
MTECRLNIFNIRITAKAAIDVVTSCGVIPAYD